MVITCSTRGGGILFLPPTDGAKRNKVVKLRLCIAFFPRELFFGIAAAGIATTRHNAAPRLKIVAFYPCTIFLHHHPRAAQVVEALEVSLDYLVGFTDVLLEQSIVNRVLDIQKLKENEKQHVFALLDAFIKQTKFQSIM